MATSIKIQDLIDIFAPEYNQLEAAYFTLLDLLDIENQTGVPLRNIARIVGTENIPDDDDLLRIFIKGQIAKNISTGTAPDLIELWAIMSQATQPITKEVYPAEVELYTDTTLPTGYETYIRDFMDNAAGAGVLIKRIINIPGDGYFQFSNDTSVTTTNYTEGFGDATDTARGGKFNYIIV